MRSSVLVVAFVVAACGSTREEAPGPAAPGAAPPANKFDRAITEVEAFRDKMCRCKDRACGDKVHDEYKAWRRGLKDQFTDQDEKNATETQNDRARAADNAIKGCRSNLRVARSSASAGEAMAKMTEFKDKMCMCRDKACADKVTEEMTLWSQEMAKTADRDIKVSEEDTKTMQSVTEEFVQCATKAMTAP